MTADRVHHALDQWLSAIEDGSGDASVIHRLDAEEREQFLSLVVTESELAGVQSDEVVRAAVKAFEDRE